MNPVFIFLVILALIAVWFLLSFLYEPIGSLFKRIWDKSVEEINKKDKGDM
ncbi:hypothetical protein [Anaerotignum sp.]|uniref:hypothetical protein n=1 Tax=Anaerotignum sp. TaxID=2039241 RepID=UPI0027148540|nr:hypothetical protein [Anaerotignum sp.]